MGQMPFEKTKTLVRGKPNSSWRRGKSPTYLRQVHFSEVLRIIFVLLLLKKQENLIF